MTARPDWRLFPSPETLAEALADDVARALGAAISRRGHALLAVSGGTTPRLFFRALARQALDWAKVTVVPVDERFVPESSPRSNGALIRNSLLAEKAAAARFAPLFREAGTVEEAARRATAALAALPWPLDASILGMGTDGHTASFFPDAGSLAALTDPASDGLVLPVHAQSAGEPRLTLTLARLLEAGFLALHIEGEEKRAVLDRALEPGGDKPVSAVFAHADKPVPVYWTP
ncbi:MAG: 6-phosphogluconolactonase [Aquamicrobium sp.]|uniref:6-phosphogluconolactonase n=1 Tax=Aquamicrobium sp. TaxID=1872579 RepID=UPI00349E6E6B|nr:6-phosphogluconolactonase [Aquamicrobium sp.]